METRECCCIFYKKSEGMPRMMQTNSCKGTVYVVKEKDSLYKQTEARIEEICKNLEYKTYKDASEEQQRLSDEIDQMKFNKEEIEKKKEKY